MIGKYVDALTEEIKSGGAMRSVRSEPARRCGLKTIYIGGGTPSLLSIPQMERIVDAITSSFNLDDDCEFSIEANPETVSKNKLVGFKKIGVNRVSVGIQSFDDNVLKYLGRIHTADTSKKALRTALEMFENVNIDLMYGMPDEKLSAIEKDIKEALGFTVKHISCYELTPEEGTPLFKDAGRQKDDDGEGYGIVKTLLEAGGFSQYEISNYSLPGYQCRHNMAYWSDQSYFGLGPGAHSFDKEKKKRWANKPDLKSYLSGDPLDFVEDAEDIDTLIMGLRKTDGLKAGEIPMRYKRIVSKLIDDGLLESKCDNVAYTKKGVLLSNKILLEIMCSTS